MGYLVCNKCGGYYELRTGESADDFSGTCECGGELEFKETIGDLYESTDSTAENMELNELQYGDSEDNVNLKVIAPDVSVVLLIMVLAIVYFPLRYIGELLNLDYSNFLVKIGVILLLIIISAYLYVWMKKTFKNFGYDFSLPKKTTKECAYLCDRCGNFYSYKEVNSSNQDVKCECGGRLKLTESPEKGIILGFCSRYWISIGMFSVSSLFVYMLFKSFNIDITDYFVDGRKYFFIFLALTISLFLTLIFLRILKFLGLKITE